MEKRRREILVLIVFILPFLINAQNKELNWETTE